MFGALAGVEVVGRPQHQPSCCSQAGVYLPWAAVSFFSLVGVSVTAKLLTQKAQDIIQRTGGRKVLDFL